MRENSRIRCVFSTGNVNAPTDRESLYYFNVMAIPPADDEKPAPIPFNWRSATAPWSIVPRRFSIHPLIRKRKARMA
ncbi:fimbria/pilus periplasmic chaperone [Klebsiella pneumoniae]|uniref:fimbria/pilus periplasmic chaperone n=1 Tax=Klebsiella pneumoniae TaxID=573 RepID=UPI00396F30C0